jgi:hypothetical protein
LTYLARFQLDLSAHEIDGVGVKLDEKKKAPLNSEALLRMKRKR